MPLLYDILQYQQIKTLNGQAGYVRLGHGAPLVLIIGYSGTIFHWNAQFILTLAERFTVYLVDNREVGLSKSSNPKTIKGLSADIIDFIEALALKNPSILGWSMGGVIGQGLIKAYGRNINKLILLATVPSTRFVMPDFLDFLVTNFMYEGESFREKLYHFFFSNNDYTKNKQLLVDNGLQIEHYHYRFTKHAKELQDHVMPVWGGMTEDELLAISQQTLAIKARNDLVVTNEAQDFMFTHIPNCQLIAYPSGGHFLIHHNPQAVARDIINFAMR